MNAAFVTWGTLPKRLEAGSLGGLVGMTTMVLLVGAENIETKVFAAATGYLMGFSIWAINPPDTD